MNKQKVLDKLDEIHDIYEQVTDPSEWGTNEYELFDEINDIAKDIQKEVNSKVKMPKVFDEWAKPYDTYTIKGLDDALKNLFDIYETQVCENKAEQALSDWLDGGYSIGKYVKCEKALIAGYEVLPCPY